MALRPIVDGVLETKQKAVYKQIYHRLIQRRRVWTTVFHSASGWQRRLGDVRAMLIRHAARWLSYLTLAGASALTVAACGSGQKGESAGGMGGASNTTSGGGGGDGGITLPDSGGCQPATCATADYTCGMNGDGCGNTIDCG